MAKRLGFILFLVMLLFPVAMAEEKTVKLHLKAHGQLVKSADVVKLGVPIIVTPPRVTEIAPGKLLIVSANGEMQTYDTRTKQTNDIGRFVEGDVDVGNVRLHVLDTSKALIVGHWHQPERCYSKILDLREYQLRDTVSNNVCQITGAFSVSLENGDVLFGGGVKEGELIGDVQRFDKQSEQYKTLDLKIKPRALTQTFPFESDNIVILNAFIKEATPIEIVNPHQKTITYVEALPDCFLPFASFLPISKSGDFLVSQVHRSAIYNPIKKTLKEIPGPELAISAEDEKRNAISLSAVKLGEHRYLIYYHASVPGWLYPVSEPERILDTETGIFSEIDIAEEERNRLSMQGVTHVFTDNKPFLISGNQVYEIIVGN